MKAAYALRRPPGSDTAHLVLDDADRSVCGRQTGEPAPAVTCAGCASRWTYTHPEGQRAAKAARREFDLLLANRAIGATPPPPRPARPHADDIAAQATARAIRESLLAGQVIPHLQAIARLHGASLTIGHPEEHGNARSDVERRTAARSC